DDRGREILTYAPGVTMWPGAPHLLHTDATIDRAAGLLRRLHALGVVHGDFGAWNVVVDVETDRWTIIDWDEVDDSDAADDVAQGVLSFCDLWSQVCPTPDEAVRRARRFVAAYGLDDASVLVVLRQIPRLCERNGRAMGRRGMADHETMWLGHAGHAAAQLPLWQVELDR
ncbi:MAG TPA: phosphotransferase, partial [Acidimicrobiales bacterium]|nr:phosphotransferase [Acidimicrobiales bacterium]